MSLQDDGNILTTFDDEQVKQTDEQLSEAGSYICAKDLGPHSSPVCNCKGLHAFHSRVAGHPPPTLEPSFRGR